MIADERMYVGVGSRVIEFAVSPALKQISSSPPLPGIVEGLAVGEDVLIAALGAAGLAVLELGDEEPELASVLELAGPALAATVVGDTAYVAAGAGGLRIIDLADPSRPRELGVALELRHVRDLAIRAGIAYLAVADEGLLVLDVSDPDAPVELGALATGGFAHGVEVDGSMGFLADGWSGLQVLNLADPARPRQLGTLPTHGWAMDVTVRDGLAYLAASAEGLLIVDVADPASPEAVGGVPLAGRHAARVVVDRGMAYVVDPFEGLQMVDVRTPAEPEPVATWQPLLAAEDIAVTDGLAYVAGGRAGLVVVDVSDPAQPEYADGLPTLAPVVMAAVADGNVLFANIPDPTADAALSLVWADGAESALGAERPFAFHAPMSAAVRGSLVAFADEEGVLIVDAADPGPCRFAFYQTNFFPEADVFAYTRAIALDGTMVYVGVEWEGIHVLDIGNPREPQLVTKIARPDEASAAGMVVIGDHLYLLEHRTLLAYDVSNPANPRLASSVELPGEPPPSWPRRLVSGGGRLFVALGGEVLAMDVSDPARPRIAGELQIPGRVMSLASDGASLYVGSDEAGLLVAAWGDAAGPEPPRSHPGAADAWDGMVAPVAWDGPDLPPPGEQPSTPVPGCTVITLEEHGPGSLNDCLGRAAGRAIVFDPAVFPPDSPATIRVTQGISPPKGTTIDGGGGVILDGGGNAEQGLYLGEGRITVRGLQIRGFSFTAIGIESAGNLIERNVIHGNPVDIYLANASGNRIVDNLIGVDASGTRVVRAPGGEGPVLSIDVASSMNRIEGNVFGGDVSVNNPGSDNNNAFVGNRIGVDPQGRRLPCSCILHGPGLILNRIGGSLPGEGNLIGGMEIGGGENAVLGNTIGGPDANPGGSVVSIRGRRNTIGGRAEGSGNRIQGRQAIELTSSASQNLLIGNDVGPGGDYGIRVNGASNAVVANTLSGAAEACVLIEAAGVGSLVLGNQFSECTEDVEDRAGEAWKSTTPPLVSLAVASAY